MNKIIKNLLDEDEILNLEAPTVYVCQFCYRSTGGRIFNIMHFYNNGSFTASKILECVNKVVMSCELIGSKVFGLISDAAGPMQRLFTLLRGKTDLPNGAWLPIECVRFKNPYDSSRYIYMFHCATHNLKNMRGQVWQSYQPGGPRDLIDMYGNHIGKDFFLESWLRDEDLAEKNGARLTDLCQGCLDLNQWNKMNAKFAKAPFSAKSLNGYLQVRLFCVCFCAKCINFDFA